MKYLIKYYDQDGSLLSLPKYSKEEIVEAKSVKDLDKYITSQKDVWNNVFKKKSGYGFDYISNSGAVKVQEYNPKIKKI